MNGKTMHKALGLLRLTTQTTALAITVLYSFVFVRSMGMPRWAFMLSIAALGVFFCGWVCPFGSVQEWLRGIGKSMTGLSIRIPARIDRYLLLSRYLFFPFVTILGIADLDTRRTFMMVIDGRVAETAAYIVLGVSIALSLFMDRPFCRYLCGFGAVAGFISMLRVFAIRRDESKCVSCGKCDHSCAMGVEVSKAGVVRDPHCINCGKCLAACPVPDALGPGFALPGFEDAKALKRKYLGDGNVVHAKDKDRKNAA